MRVIAGEAKGHHLVAPDHPATRPLTDRAREGIFSALGGLVADAVVLDLYAGSGSIGIEALSRGAARAVFVENNRKALAALRANLAAVGFWMLAEVATQKVAEYLKGATSIYRLIFFDPPWSMPTSEVGREMAMASMLVGPGGEIVVHRRYPDPLPLLPPGWHGAGAYRYGDTVLYRVAAPSLAGTAK